MEASSGTGRNFDGGFNSLICEEDLDNNGRPSFPRFNWPHQQVLMFSMTSGKRCRAAAAMLALLAAVLLIVVISMGAHYNKLTDTHLTLDDTKAISKEPVRNLNSSKTAEENIKSAKKQLASELSLQKETKWEFEYQTKRSTEYQKKIDKMTTDIMMLRSNLPLIKDGCRHCPPGWILINSICYFFPFTDFAGGYRSWQNARDFCQAYGGDLAIIDTKDKENSTVKYMRAKDLKNTDGFWIGIRDIHEEGIWKWLNGEELVEGYWNDGEPNDVNDEDCGAVYSRENIFKNWNDVDCKATMKWLCEKAPASMSSSSLYW
ncbi:CD209 antigen-like [Mugil cephalus]|uniref:CD209 antigen-like n=1 Tax=Mugil cephalus TaxID=48193 RepID=UPI001FB75576|nr:CD209 antigen-like [Mugil cephalus]